MAFVYRAENKEIIASKTPQPGPGQYDFPPQSDVIENRVSFHSSKEREITRPKSNANPGPGSYNVMRDMIATDSAQHVFFIPANPGGETNDGKTTSVFKSKGDRFGIKKVNENPGPGSYNVGKNLLRKGTNFKSNNNQNNLNLVHDIIQKGNKIAPSIPSNVHSYGYTESEDLNLVLNKNPLLQVQQFVGPGYYESKVNSQGAKYRGPAWHKSSAKKELNFENTAATSNLIGPGTYDIAEAGNPSYKTNANAGFISTTTRTADMGLKKKLGLGKFQSRTPLSSQSVGRDISNIETDDDEEDDEYIKEATPGPGYYHNESLLSSFGSKTPSSNLSLSTADKLRSFPRSLKAQAFGSSPRFVDYNNNANNNELGPGEYNVHAKPKYIAVKYAKVPFQSSNTRFLRDNIPSNPGPGNYDPPVNLVDKIKNKANAGYAGSFGVTEGRFKVSKLLEETPGPGTYINKPKSKGSLKENDKDKRSHFFVSSTSRNVFSDKNEYAAFPGTYELDYYNISKKIQKDEDDLDQPKNIGVLGFNTGQPRFPQPKEKPIPEDEDEEDEDDEPRFGTSKDLELLLKSRKPQQKPNATFLSQTKRNIGGIRNDGLPGPGTYFEQNQNPWNKRTFNIHFTGE